MIGHALWSMTLLSKNVYTCVKARKVTKNAPQSNTLGTNSKEKSNRST